MHLPGNFWILISIGLTLYIIIDERIFNQLPSTATILAQIETIGERYSPFDFNSTSLSLETIDIFDTCNLTIYDPYYKDMGMTVDWDNPMANCNRNHTPYTILKDGWLSIDPERKSQVDYCRARTYEYINPEKSRPRSWFNLVEKMQIDQDIVKTECYSKDGKIVDQWLHTQIYEGNPSTVEVDKSLGNGTNFRPDIVMIVLDSVSSTQARRSLPRTLSYLETQMGGMHFHHLNKVGENTSPNAYAMLLADKKYSGWRIYSANRKAVNAKDLRPDHDKICSGWRDKDPVIFREYEKIGYKTFYSDDYKQGTAFSWSCKGFRNQEANHIWRDYLWAWHNENKLRDFMSPKNCFEMHIGQLQQSTNFLNAYNGIPKFLLHWSCEASHDLPNPLYHTDQDYLNFFQKNKPILDNAFLFVMGDHGPRFGTPSKAELNKREINNPLLHISLPKFLRNHTQLIKNLQENSIRLLTQFDVHATLVDLLKFAPESNFTDFSEFDVMEGNENNGTSIFRPFPEKFQKRTCQTIPVNAAYCLCEYKKENIDDAMLIEKLSKVALEKLNGYLRENGVSGSCETLTLDKIKSVKSFIPVEKTNLYEIHFIVKESKGEFRVLLKKDSNGVFHREGDFLRLNKYAGQSDCIDVKRADLRRICLCKGIKV